MMIFVHGWATNDDKMMIDDDDDDDEDPSLTKRLPPKFRIPSRSYLLCYYMPK